MANGDVREELSALKKLRLKILKVLGGSLDASEIESYSVSETDGSQSVKRRSPKELMEILDSTDKKIAALERSLRGGGGIMTFGVNRYAR